MGCMPRDITFPELHFDRDLVDSELFLDHTRSVLDNFSGCSNNQGGYQFHGARCVEALPRSEPASYWEVQVQVTPRSDQPEEEICTVGVATEAALRSCNDEEGFVLTDHFPGVTTVLRWQGSRIWGLSSRGETLLSDVQVAQYQHADTYGTIITTVELGFLWDQNNRRIFVIDWGRSETLLRAGLQENKPLFFAAELVLAEFCGSVGVALQSGPRLAQAMSGDKFKFLDDLLATQP